MASGDYTKIQNAVPNTLTLSGTSPIRIDGGASADLSANRAVSILAASGSNAGSMSASDFTKLSGIASGAAALTSSAPANVTKASASAGTGTTAARSDHKHDITTAAVTTIGTSNSEGTATSLARSDHVHDHGAQTSGTLHAAATTSVAGFLSAADKTRYDAIPIAHSWHNQVIAGTASTTYMYPWLSTATQSTTEGPANTIMVGKAGTLKNFRCKHGAAGSGTNRSVYTIRVNSVDTALTVTITNDSTTLQSDTTHTASVSVGDIISISSAKPDGAISGSQGKWYGYFEIIPS